MILNKILYSTVTIFDVILAAIILIFTIILTKSLSIYLRRFLKEKVNKETLEIILKIVYYFIIIGSILVILPMLGIKLSGLLVAGGIVGIAIGFASQNIIANLLSGVFLMIERPISIGDTVNIDQITGIVEDIQIMSTTLRTFDGIYVRIPNEKVFRENITNYVTNKARRFEYIVGISYHDDADKAIKIIKEIINEAALALVYPKPQVFVNNLGDSSVNIIVRIWAPATEWYELKTELLWVIKQTLEKNDIEIAFPQRVLWFGNELQTRQLPP